MIIHVNKDWLEAKIKDAMENTVAGTPTDLAISKEIAELCQEYEIDGRIKELAKKKGIQIVVGELF